MKNQSKNSILILADTRQKCDKHITDCFDKNNVQWIRTGLPSADYMAVRYKDGFIKDYSILIDTKKDVEELAHNLCGGLEHKRIKREIELAKMLGCKRFIFLVCDSKIKNAEDLKNWSSRFTKVKGETLLKIICTMAKRYDIEFIFTSPIDAGNKIIEILSE